MDGEANVLARLIKKVLYVGAFAYIINNFSYARDAHLQFLFALWA